MKHYIKIYKRFFSLNLSTLFIYRSNFINSMISTLVWGVISIVSILLLTSKIKTVYGWTGMEILMLTGAYNIFTGVFHMLFSRNFDRFSRIIFYGELDPILLKPADSQFLLSTWFVNYTSIFRVVTGIIVVWFIAASLHVSVTFLSIVLFVVLGIIGIIILYSLWYILCTFLVWNSNLTNLVDILYQMNGISRYPPEIFINFNTLVFFFLFPITLIMATPVRYLIQKASFFDAIILLLFAVILLLISRIFWKFALRHYSSASS